MRFDNTCSQEAINTRKTKEIFFAFRKKNPATHITTSNRLWSRRLSIISSSWGNSRGWISFLRSYWTSAADPQGTFLPTASQHNMKWYALSQAVSAVRNTFHPGQSLVILLPSGRCAWTICSSTSRPAGEQFSPSAVCHLAKLCTTLISTPQSQWPNFFSPPIHSTLYSPRHVHLHYLWLNISKYIMLQFILYMVYVPYNMFIFTLLSVKYISNWWSTHPRISNC